MADIAPTETKEKPSSLISPAEYVNKFMQTTEVANAIDKLYRDAVARNPNGGISRDEMIEIFPDRDLAVDLLWKFYQENPPSFDYRSLSRQFSQDLEDYFRIIRMIKKKEQHFEYENNQTECIDDDRLRSAKHTTLASQLVKEGAAPNTKIGRELIKFMTIDRGIEQSIQSQYRDRAGYQ